MRYLIDGLARYLDEGLGYSVQEHVNPCDLAIDLANTDFIRDPDQRRMHIERLAFQWKELSHTYADDDSQVNTGIAEDK